MTGGTTGPVVTGSVGHSTTGSVAEPSGAVPEPGRGAIAGASGDAGDRGAELVVPVFPFGLVVVPGLTEWLEPGVAPATNPAALD